MEDLVTEVETTEPIVEVEETVTSVDDLSDEQFEEHFDKIGNEDVKSETDESEPSEKVELTDEDLYKTQITDTDAKLDKTVILKHDGEIYKIDNLNELRNLAEKGFNATKKFTKLAEDRKALEAQLQALGQEPNIEAVDESSDAVNDVAEQILESNYADTFKSDISTLPSEAREFIAGDAKVLQGLAMVYESGLAQKIVPRVKREMAIKNLSFIDAYMSVGKTIQSRQEDVQQKKQILSAEPKQTSYASSAVDVDKMSDKDFDAYFENL